MSAPFFCVNFNNPSKHGKNHTIPQKWHALCISGTVPSDPENTPFIRKSIQTSAGMDFNSHGRCGLNKSNRHVFDGMAIIDRQLVSPIVQFAVKYRVALCAIFRKEFICLGSFINVYSLVS